MRIHIGRGAGVVCCTLACASEPAPPASWDDLADTDVETEVALTGCFEPVDEDVVRFDDVPFDMLDRVVAARVPVRNGCSVATVLPGLRAVKRSGVDVSTTFLTRRTRVPAGAVGELVVAVVPSRPGTGVYELFEAGTQNLLGTIEVHSPPDQRFRSVMPQEMVVAPGCAAEVVVDLQYRGQPALEIQSVDLSYDWSWAAELSHELPWRLGADELLQGRVIAKREVFRRTDESSSYVVVLLNGSRAASATVRQGEPYFLVEYPVPETHYRGFPIRLGLRAEPSSLIVVDDRDRVLTHTYDEDTLTLFVAAPARSVSTAYVAGVPVCGGP